jgi:hypothetical protein
MIWIILVQTVTIVVLAGISFMLYEHIKLLRRRLDQIERRTADLEYWRMEQGSGSPYSIVRNNTYGRGPYD